MDRRRSRVGAVLVSLLACGALPACAASAIEVGGIEGEVSQSRTQYADRVVSLVVRAAGEALTLTAAELRADGFTDSSVDGLEMRIGPDRPRGVAVPVPLGQAVCGPGDGAVALDPSASEESARVSLTVQQDGFGATVLEVAATDPLDRLAAIHKEDCAAAAVAGAAALTIEDRVEDLGDGTARLRLRIAPVPGGPEVRIEEIQATTLFSRADGATWTGSALERQSGGEVPLRIIPSRCDAHVLAEDKRGTFVPVHASVDGVRQAPVYVPMPDAARRALIDFITRTCGLGE